MAVPSRVALATWARCCCSLPLGRPVKAMSTSAAKTQLRARASAALPSLLVPRDLAPLPRALGSSSAHGTANLGPLSRRRAYPHFGIRAASSSSSSSGPEAPATSTTASSQTSTPSTPTGTSSPSSSSSSSTSPPKQMPGPWAHDFVPGPRPATATAAAAAPGAAEGGAAGEMPPELQEMKKILDLMDQYEQQMADQTAAQAQGQKEGSKATGQQKPSPEIQSAPPAMPPELKAIMDEYERRIEDKPWYQRMSINPMIFGAILAGLIVYTIAALDDISSELHQLTSKWLSSLDPEVAKRRILKLAAWNLLPSDLDKDDPYLVLEPQEGLRFVTPVGLATGYDVEGVGINSFLKLGFGHVEVGPVRSTERDDILALRQKLANRDRAQQVISLGIVGVCVRGTAAKDLVAATEALAPFVDYISVDVRGLPVDQLRDILSQVVAQAACVPSGGPAIFVRLHQNYPAKDAHNSERIEAARKVATAALAAGVTGMVLAHAQDEDMVSNGFAKDILGEVYKHSEGKLILIASGRFPSGFKALEYIEHGATLVQISDQLGELGLPICRKIKTDLSRALMQDNITRLQDCVGAAHRKKKVKARNLWKAKGAS